MRLHLALAVGFTSLVLPVQSSSIVKKPPTQSQWASLNKTIHGRLYAGFPWSKPCYTIFNGRPSQPNTQECQDVQKIYFNESYSRSDHFGAWSATQWEECMTTNEECELDWQNPTNTSTFAGKNCQQGSVPPYYIDVSSKDDVIAALKFVKTTGVALSIKNSGHDFNGRSTAPNSLSLWTHHLKAFSHSDSFVPDGCSHNQKSTAVTFGAGAQFQDVYSYADSHGLVVIGGTDPGVGPAGGWGQGGGHSSLSRIYGMGADRTLQYRVVTPDGVYRTANACQNEDLFWALRGGGGGTFGVVLEATMAASPRVPLRVANINWAPTASNYKKVLKVFIDNATTFAEHGWGGYVTMNIGNIVLANPKVSLADAKNQMKALIDLTANMGGVVSEVTESSSYLNWVHDFMDPYSASQDAIGLPIAFTSRLIPKKNHDTVDSRAKLLDAMIEAQTKVFWTQIMFTTPYGSGIDGSDTSVNPAWRNSLYHVMLINTWDSTATLADKKQAWQTGTEAANALRAVTPGSGAYHNEGDLHEPNWEYSFWGANYPRLLSIKNKYDPTGVLDCWHCVGWKSANSPRYKCYV